MAAVIVEVVVVQRVFGVVKDLAFGLISVFIFVGSLVLTRQLLYRMLERRCVMKLQE